MKASYKPEDVKALFDKMSNSYERVNYITSFGFSLRWRRQFLAPLPPLEGKINVIDLMTGMGEIWPFVKKQYPHSEFSALDFSEGMLEHARKKNENHFDGTVNLLNQNVLQNELPSDHYDVVLSAFGMKTFSEEQLKILADEIVRILKPGGQFSFIEVSRPKNKLLHIIYKAHLKYIVPIFGRILLGNPDEYKMLWQYTEVYANSDKLAKIFTEAGLNVQKQNYFNGCATGISGSKN